MGSALQTAVTDFLQPLQDAANDPQALLDWLSIIGQTEKVSGDPALGTIIQQGAALLQQLKALNPSTLDSWSGIQQILALARGISGLTAELRQFASDPSRAQAAEGLAEDILSLMLASYLRRKHPTAFRVAGLLTLVEAREYGTPDQGLVVNDAYVKNPRVVDQFRFDSVNKLFTAPGATLSAAYFPNGMATAVDAWNGSRQFFDAVSFFLREIGVAWNTQFHPSGGAIAPPAEPDADHNDNPEGNTADADDEDIYSDSTWGSNPDLSPTLAPPPVEFYPQVFPTLQVQILGSSTSGPSAQIELMASSAQHPGGVAGYLLTPAGSFNNTATFSGWKLTISATGQIPAFVLKPTGVELAPAGSPVTNGTAKVLLERLPPTGNTGPVLVVGNPTGTRLELGSVSFEADLFFDPSRKAASVAAKAGKSSFIIAAGDGDGFVSAVLPKNGINIVFNAGIEWSSETGLSFNGGAGLDITLPIGLSIGGVVSVPSVRITLLAGGTGLQLQLSASLGVTIGPVQAAISELGIASNLTFPAGGGNFGPADFDIGFKSPSGVGLAVDSAGVSGGGFLRHDDPTHQYSGVLQLQFTDLALQAFGLISTQIAGNSGYSLLALIDANFPPIQLGWGFTLTGAGGILAVNRTADVDALHAALKADKLSTILFPKNAIANAPQILAELALLFPAAEGRFLFGPMALISWGTPTVLTVALAVILELPEPIRIILIARLAARLPSQSSSLVRINMDALGILDLSQGQLSLDATLFDSKLIGYTLSGDMSLRANWGTQREFLLAIGGFHPQFTPPPGFPVLQRITIDMPSGPIAKLRLAAYLAITSNTLQFGANLDVAIGVAGFGLKGHLGFDALLQIDPFHFEADISGSIALTAGGDDLMSVELDATLSGPAPWNIAGKFKIHIIFFDVHKSFSYTWGDGTSSQQIPAVDVTPLLSTALADSRNWGTQLPANTPALVSLRSHDGSTVVAHPLAQLEVHESLVPLGIQIARFGAATLTGSNTFTITDFLLNGSSVFKQTAPVQDDFAPAQFFDLSDVAKLASPSFEPHDAGVRLTPAGATSGPSHTKAINYETFYVDQPNGALREDAPTNQTVLTQADLTMILGLGAAGRAEVRKAGKQRFQGPAKAVSIKPQRFTLANTETLQAAGIVPVAGVTYSEARALLAKTATGQPTLAAQLQIVATHELSAA